MTEHTVVTRDEWLAARKQLLEEEQKHAERSEELARKRRELPSVQVDKDYQTPKGRQVEFRAYRHDEYSDRR